MKRIVSLVLCMALAIGSVTYKPPQAKAVVLETTGAVALVGIFLTAMGLYWAYDNYQSAVLGSPVTKFGSNLAEELDEYIYEKTGEHRNVIDVMFHGDPDMGPNFGDDLEMVVGTIVTVSSAAVASISAFGKWLYDKYALSENDSAVVYSDSGSITLNGVAYPIKAIDLSGWRKLGSSYKLDSASKTLVSGGSIKSLFDAGSLSFMYDGVERTIEFKTSTNSDNQYVLNVYVDNYSPGGIATNKADFSQWDAYFANLDGYLALLRVSYNSTTADYLINDRGYTGNLTLSKLGVKPYSLSVSAPSGLNLPDTEVLPEGQGFALEFPDIIADDFPSLLEQAVPQVLTNPEYVPTLNPVEITNPDPNPTPSDEEVPDPAPEGANFLDYLVDIWRKFKAFPETMLNGIKNLFVPDPALLTEITSTFNSKFGWLETVHRFGNDLFGMTADTAPPVIYIHLEDAEGQYNYGGMEKALDLSWYQRYKADVDHILSGFMWLAFLWLVFKRASAIIQGGEMITEYTNDLDQGHR